MPKEKKFKNENQDMYVRSKFEKEFIKVIESIKAEIKEARTSGEGQANPDSQVEGEE
jgi:hypothetical protein